MGGFGSGERLEKKTTVERCLTLDVGRFSKAVEVKHGLCSSGELTWTNSRKEQILSLRYWLEPKAKDFAVLHITTTLEAHRMEPVVERIRLTCTVPNFGGLRWWFVCPLVNAGVACAKWRTPHLCSGRPCSTTASSRNSAAVVWVWSTGRKTRA